MNARAIAAAAISSLAANACGPSGTSGDGGPDAGSVEQACTDKAQATCNLRDSCSSGWLISTIYGDMATCLSRTRTNCLNASAASGTSVTAASDETCAQATTSQSCADYYFSNTPTACLPPPGGIASGGACAFSGQCQSGFCSIPKNQVCGVCGTLPQAGASCAITSCGLDLVCLADTLVCSGPIPDGGSCSDRYACGPRATCLGLAAGSAGVCRPSGRIGVSCQPSSRTLPSCDGEDGVYCGAGATPDGGEVCLSIQLGSAGAPCGELDAGRVDCTNGALCVLSPPDGGSGTCQAYANDGLACDSVAGPPCLEPAKCVPSGDGGGTAGICTLPNAALCQ